MNAGLLVHVNLERALGWGTEWKQQDSLCPVLLVLFFILSWCCFKMSSKGLVTLISNNFIFNIEEFMPSLITSNLLFSACFIERKKKRMNAG